MKGKGFATIKEIKAKSKQELSAIQKGGIKSVARIGKNAGCIIYEGGYFERDYLVSFKLLINIDVVLYCIVLLIKK